jgi:hypothetical protein
MKSVSQTPLINNNYGPIGETLAPKLVRLYLRSLETEHLLQASSPKVEMFVERFKRTFHFKTSSETDLPDLECEKHHR